jgi:hypothetical protein
MNSSVAKMCFPFLPLISSIKSMSWERVELVAHLLPWLTQLLLPFRHSSTEHTERRERKRERVDCKGSIIFRLNKSNKIPLLILNQMWCLENIQIYSVEKVLFCSKIIVDFVSCCELWLWLKFWFRTSETSHIILSKLFTTWTKVVNSGGWADFICLVNKSRFCQVKERKISLHLNLHNFLLVFCL